LSLGAAKRRFYIGILEKRITEYWLPRWAAGFLRRSVENLTERSFGLIIAFLVPGFVGVLALGETSGPVASWLAAAPQEPATVGGFLYATLASIGLGGTFSAFRWAALDLLHHKSGLKPPEVDFAKLQGRMEAFEGAVHNHYRYYQFYGNLLMALLLSTLGLGVWPGFLQDEPLTGVLMLVCLGSVLFAASRDALEKYYERSRSILQQPQFSRSPSDDKRLAQARGDRRASDQSGRDGQGDN
jgi:hypothetical protein